MTATRAWPEPYLQPDRTQDCGYYAAAYIARCLGHPDTTAEQVKAWRVETHTHEDHYVRKVLGVEMCTFWDFCSHDAEKMATTLARGNFWMGPQAENWVRSR